MAESNLRFCNKRETTKSPEPYLPSNYDQKKIIDGLESGERD